MRDFGVKDLFNYSNVRETAVLMRGQKEEKHKGSACAGSCEG